MYLRHAIVVRSRKPAASPPAVPPPSWALDRERLADQRERLALHLEALGASERFDRACVHLGGIGIRFGRLRGHARGEHRREHHGRPARAVHLASVIGMSSIGGLCGWKKLSFFASAGGAGYLAQKRKLPFGLMLTSVSPCWP